MLTALLLPISMIISRRAYAVFKSAAHPLTTKRSRCGGRNSSWSTDEMDFEVKDVLYEKEESRGIHKTVVLEHVRKAKPFAFVRVNSTFSIERVSEQHSTNY